MSSRSNLTFGAIIISHAAIWKSAKNLYTAVLRNWIYSVQDYMVFSEGTTNVNCFPGRDFWSGQNKMKRMCVGD